MHTWSFSTPVCPATLPAYGPKVGNTHRPTNASLSRPCTRRPEPAEHWAGQKNHPRFGRKSAMSWIVQNRFQLTFDRSTRSRTVRVRRCRRRHHARRRIGQGRIQLGSNLVALCRTRTGGVKRERWQAAVGQSSVAGVRVDPSRQFADGVLDQAAFRFTFTHDNRAMRLDCRSDHDRGQQAVQNQGIPACEHRLLCACGTPTAPHKCGHAWPGSISATTADTKLSTIIFPSVPARNSQPRQNRQNNRICQVSPIAVVGMGDLQLPGNSQPPDGG